MSIHVDVSVSATHTDIQRAVLSLYEMASGHASPNTAARALLVRIGLATLANIKQAFLIKARGGTDAAGLSWPKLSKKTVAYSRRHPGVLFPGAQRALYAPSWMLKEKQRVRWWQLYRQYGGTGGAGTHFHAGHNPYAARLAWRIVKAEGGKTLLGEYGDVQVEILRDKGLLYNSLSPGIPAMGHAVPAFAVPNGPDQVFRIERAAVIVGTNRKHARTHHDGLGNVPQRKLWPDPRSWPASWWDSILEACQQGVVDIALEILRGA
jgi:hypothetical protein